MRDVKVYPVYEIEFQTFLLLGKTLILYSVFITTFILFAVVCATVHLWPITLLSSFVTCVFIASAFGTALEMRKMVKRVVDACYFQSDDEDMEDGDYEKPKDKQPKNKPATFHVTPAGITDWLHHWLTEKNKQPLGFKMNENDILHRYGLDYDDMKELLADAEKEFDVIINEYEDFTVKEFIDLILGEQL